MESAQNRGSETNESTDNEVNTFLTTADVTQQNPSNSNEPIDNEVSNFLTAIEASHHESNNNNEQAINQTSSKTLTTKSPSNQPTQIPASTRVFAIPELLSEILTAYAHTAEKPTGPYGGYGLLRTPSLLPLRRVNSAFQETIDHAPSLRNWIKWTSNLDTFFSEIGIDSNRKVYMGETLKLNAPSFPRAPEYIEGIHWGLSEQWTEPSTASWRAIKAFGRRERDDYGRKIDEVRIVFGPQNFKFVGKIQWARVLVVRREEDPSLGEIYEEYRKIVLDGLAFRDVEDEERRREDEREAKGGEEKDC